MLRGLPQLSVGPCEQHSTRRRARVQHLPNYHARRHHNLRTNTVCHQLSRHTYLHRKDAKHVSSWYKTPSNHRTVSASLVRSIWFLRPRTLVLHLVSTAHVYGTPAAAPGLRLTHGHGTPVDHVLYAQGSRVASSCRSPRLHTSRTASCFMPVSPACLPTVLA